MRPLGYDLWHASLAWQQAIGRALAPHELTHVQFFLLASLLWFGKRDQQPKQRELAQAIKRARFLALLPHVVK